MYFFRHEQKFNQISVYAEKSCYAASTVFLDIIENTYSFVTFVNLLVLYYYVSMTQNVTSITLVLLLQADKLPCYHCLVFYCLGLNDLTWANL